MAKRANGAPASALDAIENGDDAGDELIDEVEAAPADIVESPEPENPVEVRSLILEIPSADAPAGVYLQRRVDLRMSQQQSIALRSLFEGLHATHAKLANGRHVDSVQESVQWLLELVSSRLGAA